MATYLPYILAAIVFLACVGLSDKRLNSTPEPPVPCGHSDTCLNATNPDITPGLEIQTPTPDPYIRGKATYYDLPSRMGCLPLDWYDRNDPTIIAVAAPQYREWPCGTTFEVCGPAGCIIGWRQDSCPGCGINHLDLSVAGSRAVCGVPSTCDVKFLVIEVARTGDFGYNLPNDQGLFKQED